MTSVEQAASGSGTLTLTDFLLARIAEDEDYWRPVLGDLETVAQRLLIECEAKRRIVHLHSGPDYWESPDYHLCVDSMTHNEQCETLLALALPYADHPDYRAEWKP